MDSRLTRQRFVDRIESVRLRADWEEYCIDELGSPGMAQAGQRALDLLCSDDPRLYGFWDLMENFKDDIGLR